MKRTRVPAGLQQVRAPRHPPATTIVLEYTDRTLLDKFNGLEADGLDAITTAYNVPLVHCTLYLKVKYEVERRRAK